LQPFNLHTVQWRLSDSETCQIKFEEAKVGDPGWHVKDDSGKDRIVTCSDFSVAISCITPGDIELQIEANAAGSRIFC
jgi:hypothetical protein